MSLKRLLQNNWFIKIVVVANIVGAVLVWFVFSRLDSVVNVDLYKYGLQFNSAWYGSYSLYLRLGYVCLGVPIVLGVVALSLEFVKIRMPAYGNDAKLKATVSPTVFPNEHGSIEGNGLLKENGECFDDQVKSEINLQKVVDEAKGKESEGSVVISCPNCKKVFSRPMVMLDFASGAKLVNVCPYCSQILGEAQEDKSTDKNIHIANMDEKLKH